MPVNIIILSESACFPWGMAATNRVKNLAKGIMARQQCLVEYFGLRGADVAPSDDKKRGGTWAGIKYFYPGGFAVRSANWWLRRLDDLLGTLCSIYYVLLKKITYKLDAVIIYSRNHHTVSFWVCFLHILNVPVVLEVCEWPLTMANVNNKERTSARKFCFTAVPRADAVLPISSYIDKEIKKIAASKHKIIPSLVIPILIDIEPNQVIPSHKNEQAYLLYSGAIAYMEIAQFVVDTVHELRRRGFNLTIKFTGSGKKERFDKLKEYAADKGVLQYFEFTGFLDEDDLYSLMRGALALLAPLPENVQSEARFSTKLGYYLASGTPVVTNNVGDVGLYLQDGVNAFVAEKYNVQQFVPKIEQILNDPASAVLVGKNGQQLAFDKFHYLSACKDLDTFLQKLIRSYCQ